MDKKKAEVILQYRQREVDMDEVFRRIEEDYKARGKQSRDRETRGICKTKRILQRIMSLTEMQ